MTGRIQFNGQEYESVEKMPPHIREAYQKLTSVFVDANGNGMPDIFEKAGAAADAQVNLPPVIAFNGRTYHSMDELPPEARKKYEAAMGKLDVNHDGVLDILQNAGVVLAEKQPEAWTPGHPEVYPRVQETSPVDELYKPAWPVRGRWLLLGVIAIVLFMIIMGISVAWLIK